jgi:hypothetical protein
MADAADSKSVARKGVWVQVPPPALQKRPERAPRRQARFTSQNALVQSTRLPAPANDSESTFAPEKAKLLG